MVDLASPDLKPAHLNLCAFSAIYQEDLVGHRNYLRRRVPVVCRKCGIIAKYGYAKHMSEYCKGIDKLMREMLHQNRRINCVFSSLVNHSFTANSTSSPSINSLSISSI